MVIFTGFKKYKTYCGRFIQINPVEKNICSKQVPYDSLKIMLLVAVVTRRTQGGSPTPDGEKMFWVHINYESNTKTGNQMDKKISLMMTFVEIKPKGKYLNRMSANQLYHCSYYLVKLTPAKIYIASYYNV